MGYYISKPTQEAGVYIYLHKTVADGATFYVGQGKGDRAWTTTNRNKLWCNVYKKHGAVVEIVRSNMTRDEANDMERTLIAAYGRRYNKTGTLTNITCGGDGIEGYRHTEATKQRIAAHTKGIKQRQELIDKRMAAVRSRIKPEKAAKQPYKFPEERKRKYSAMFLGENNPMHGRNHSNSTKMLISAVNKGRTPTEATREKLRNARVGTTLSDITKQKIGDASRGRVLPPALIANIKEAKRAIGVPVRCVETGVIFRSTVEAVEWLVTAHGHSKAQGTGIRNAVRRGGSAYGFHWELHPA